MINQTNIPLTNTSPRGTKTDAPVGGITVNLNFYDKLPCITTENTKFNIVTAPFRLPSLQTYVDDGKPQKSNLSANQDAIEVEINQFTEKIKDCDFTKVDFVWPVSSSVKPIKKKAVRLKPPQPIVIRPFASLINTEDAVALLRKLQFY